MHMGYARLLLKLINVRSLKEKRSHVKRLISDLRKKFNVSVIESGENDSKAYMEIAFSIVARSKGELDSLIERVENFIEYDCGYMIVDEEREAW